MKELVCWPLGGANQQLLNGPIQSCLSHDICTGETLLHGLPKPKKCFLPSALAWTQTVVEERLLHYLRPPTIEYLGLPAANWDAASGIMGITGWNWE